MTPRGVLAGHPLGPAAVVIERRDPADDPGLAARLLEIQHAAYAIEARLIGDDRIPPLSEDVTELVGAGLDWLVATGGGAVLGALALTDDGGGTGIDRLVVDLVTDGPPVRPRRGRTGGAGSPGWMY